MDTINVMQMLNDATCQDIDDLLKDVNASEYEQRNMTFDEYVQSFRSPYCDPKPYPTPEGLKKWTVTVILILCLLFGLVGNTLSATIMFRRSRRGLSSYFYLALLAIIDICILYTGCLLFLLEVAFNYHPQSSSSFLCRLAFYIQHLFTYISAWLIVAVTFERFMVVRFPFQSIRICRMRVAYTTTMIIFLFFICFTSHCFFTMDLMRIDLQTDVGRHPQQVVCDLIIYQKVLAVADLCLYSVLPSILLLIFNILIIVTMFHAIKKRRDYLQANSYAPTTDISQRNKNKSSSTIRTQFFRSRSAESTPAARSVSQVNKQRVSHRIIHNQHLEQKIPCDSSSATGIRLTCLLLIISFIFILCTLPISIRSLIAEYLSPQKSTAYWQMTHLGLTSLMYLNHTVNFVLYCLTGRTFRSECRKLLRTLWFFKGIRISCTTNPNVNKHSHTHQQKLVLLDRKMILHPQTQRVNVVIRGTHL